MIWWFKVKLETFFCYRSVSSKKVKSDPTIIILSIFTKTPDTFLLGSCIPNLNSKFQVGFRVGTSFRESRRDELNVIFSLLLKILLKGSFRLVFRVFSQFFHDFSRKLRSERVFASRDEFGKSSNNSFQP